MVRLAEEAMTELSFPLLLQPEQICFFLPASLISIHHNLLLLYKTKSQ